MPALVDPGLLDTSSSPAHVSLCTGIERGSNACLGFSDGVILIVLGLDVALASMETQKLGAHRWLCLPWSTPLVALDTSNGIAPGLGVGTHSRWLGIPSCPGHQK